MIGWGRVTQIWRCRPLPAPRVDLLLGFLHLLSVKYLLTKDTVCGLLLPYLQTGADKFRFGEA